MNLSSVRIIELWEALLERDPTAPALVDPAGATFERRAVEERAQAIQSQLAEVGVKGRVVVVLSLPNGLEWMASLIACLRRGHVPVFADHGGSDADLQLAATAMGAAALFDAAGARQARAIGRTRRFRDRAVALGKLTSGSTGQSRCLFFTDAEMIADGRMTLDAFGIEATDAVLGQIPWGHSYGLGIVVMPFMILGNRISWCPSALPAEIERCCSAVRPTIFPTVPTVIRALARSGLNPAAFRSLRTLVTAGARLDPEVAATFAERYGVVPRNLYGSSETGSVCSDPDGTLTLNGRGVGYSLPGVSIDLARDGRLRVESPATFTHGNRSRVALGFGRCLMGDYGTIEADGLVRVGTRAKGFAKVGEKRVGLAEVESRLEALPEVSGAHALTVERRGSVVIGAVIETSLDRVALAEAIRRQLPGRFRPRVWTRVDALPLTPRGKRDGQRIAALLQTAAEETGTFGVM